ncbi:hypothetical protein BT69DRAFT_1318678 [Atractiella rhizophila]|nr:hypothetical protein BT69DRAFT_1318678 [Atractiella rhizophila]
MLLALISGSTGESDPQIVFKFTRPARKVWNSKQCSFSVHDCVSDAHALSSIPQDESLFPVTLVFDPDSQENFTLLLSVDPESGVITSSSRTAESLSSCNCPRIIDTVISVFIQLAWVDDPFRELPYELMDMIFTAMIDADDVHIERRRKSHLPRYLQQLRLVNRQFAKTAFPTLCRVLGTFTSPPVIFGSHRASHLSNSPLALFKRYPEATSSWMRQLVIRDSATESVNTTWILLIDVFKRCRNLNWIVLFVKPTADQNVRKAVLSHLLSLQRLTTLQITNCTEHGDCRWGTKDLSFLLSQTLLISRLAISGWDLREDDDFQTAQKPARLELLDIKSCPVHLKTLRAFLPLLLPSVTIEEGTLPTFTFLYEGFWPGLVTPEDVLRLVNGSGALFYEVGCQLRPFSKTQTEPLLRQLKPLDEHFYSLKNVQVILLDGGDEGSNLISPQFLLGISKMPALIEVILNWCFIQADTIPSFLAAQEEYAEAKPQAISLIITPLIGDFPWTISEFNEKLCLIRNDEMESSFEETEVGIHHYRGRYFEIFWNEGGTESVTAAMRW